MGSSSGPKLSGIQKQVLSLYRGFLRAARLKSHEDRVKIESVVSAEFRRNSKEVDRKNFMYIEYLIRRGRKQLDQLKSHDTIGLTSVKLSSSQAEYTKRRSHIVVFCAGVVYAKRRHRANRGARVSGKIEWLRDVGSKFGLGK